MSLKDEQQTLCSKHGSAFIEAPEHLMVGLARQTMGQQPIYGIRHPLEGVGSGWFIWAGSEVIPPDADFFQPVHVACLADHVPGVMKYLGLAPGHGFIIDDKGYVDVWFDASLLNAA